LVEIFSLAFIRKNGWRRFADGISNRRAGDFLDRHHQLGILGFGSKALNLFEQRIRNTMAETAKSQKKKMTSVGEDLRA